jgi:type I restriction enzyme S subunit
MTQTMIMGNLSALPRGWAWTRLGDIVGFVKGKKPKNLGTRNNLLTIPYIDINAFENKIFDEFTDADNCPLCQTNDILIVWDGARCGLVGSGVAGAIGSTLAKLPCFEVNSTYIFYFLQSMYESINKRPRGVGIPHVEQNVFWNISIPLPPFPEQQHIVAKIEELFTRLDAGVEALRKIKAQLKRYRQAVLKHAFEGKLTEDWRQAHKHEIEPASVLLDCIKRERHKTAKGKYKELPPLDTSTLPQLPQGWVWAGVGEIYDIVGGGTPSTAIAEYWEGDIPWITSADIFGLRDIRPRRQITRQAIENSATNLVPAGSLIVVTRVGLGKIALTKTPICFSQDSQALVAGNTSLFSEYSLYCLSEAVQVFKYKHRGTTINGVAKKQLAELPFAVAPLAEQHRIVEEIDNRFSVADEIEKTVDHSLKQAERLRQSILKRAFEGKLVPQDPNDEPAEKLLERIRQERASQQAERKPAKSSRNKLKTKQMRLV